MTFARSLAEIFGDDVIKHRALAKKGALDHVAVTFSIERAQGWESATALLRERCDVVDGNVSLPGLPFVHIIASEEALRALFSGKGDVAAMAMLGEVRVEGDVSLLNELAACFKAGQSPLNVRLQR